MAALDPNLLRLLKENKVVIRLPFGTLGAEGIVAILALFVLAIGLIVFS